MVRKPTTRPALTNAKPDNALDRTEGMPAAKQHAPFSPANKTPSQPLSRKELVFIDQGVDDYPTLIAAVLIMREGFCGEHAIAQYQITHIAM